LLQDRVKEDADPRRLAKRNPVAVFGALGSVAAIGVVTTVRGLAERNRRRSDKDVDALIARLGGRVNKLRGRARERFRKQLREEIGEIEQKPTPLTIATNAISSAVTAGLTLLAQRFASRLVGDEDLPPPETVDTTVHVVGSVRT
jgi:hypothetical protein